MSTFSANGSPTCTAGRLVGPPSVERVGGEDGCAADAVAAGAGAEQHDLVAGAAGVREVQVLVAQHADRERVDERVRLVDRVEHRSRRRCSAGRGSCRRTRCRSTTPCTTRAVSGWSIAPKRSCVHDGDRARAHRDDVAHDAADAGRGALERLDVARVVVALDLERDRPALADVDDAGVLAHADHEVACCISSETFWPNWRRYILRRLVGAVLAPHHRVHRELAAGGAAAEDLADARRTRRA